LRLSKEQAAKNRRGIIEAAARLFRERGIDGVGVADLMKAAGFTHGGFYNHFPSKEALAAEACASAFEGEIAEMTKVFEAAKSEPGFRKYVEKYLSPSHRDQPDGGCPTASLAADAWRQGDEVQAAYTEGIESVLAAFEDRFSKGKTAKLDKGSKADKSDKARADKRGNPEVAREQAVRLLSEIVGALVLSRAVAGANPSLSDEILRISREKLST